MQKDIPFQFSIYRVLLETDLITFYYVYDAFTSVLCVQSIIDAVGKIQFICQYGKNKISQETEDKNSLVSTKDKRKQQINPLFLIGQLNKTKS